MPILPTYTASGDSGYQLGYHSGGRRADTSDFNADGGAILARGVSNAVDTVGSAESRKALVTSTELRAQYAQRLDQAAQTGEDLGPIKEQMQNDFAKAGEGLYTNAGQSDLRLHLAQSNIMFDQQANAIAVHRAGVDAQIEAGKFLNGTAALLNTTPSYLPTALQDAKTFAASFTHVTAAQRDQIAAHLESQLNVAAAVASARLNPAETINRLQAGEWSLTPQEREEAIGHAKMTQRAQRADEDHARALKEYNEREADETGRDELFKGIINGTTKPGDIMNDARLKPTTREHLITFMEVRSRELATQEKKSDPVTMRNLWTAINAPQGDPRKTYNSDPIFNAVQAGLINTRDADYLNGLVANQKDENGRTIGSKLGGLMSIVDRALSQDPRYIGQPGLVAEIQMDYQDRVYKKVEAMRAAGKDPNELFNPASKEFVGSREFIQGSVDGVSARARAAQPSVTDLRQNPNADIPVGSPFIDSKGRQAVMTQQAFDARKAAGAASQAPNAIRSNAEKQVDKIYGKGNAPEIKTVPETPASKPLPLAPDQTPKSSWNKRDDGTQKGIGFLGLLKRPDGSVSSEISIGVELDGKKREIPTLVPTLTRGEVDWLLAGKKPTETIVNKAVAWARQRLDAGKPVFAQPGEAPVGLQSQGSLTAEDKNLSPEEATVRKPSTMDPTSGWAQLFGAKPPPPLSEKERPAALASFKAFKRIATDFSPKRTQEQRNRAVTEMVRLAARLGLTQEQVEQALGRPISDYSGFR